MYSGHFDGIKPSIAWTGEGVRAPGPRRGATAGTKPSACQLPEALAGIQAIGEVAQDMAVPLKRKACRAV